MSHLKLAAGALTASAVFGSFALLPTAVPPATAQSDSASVADYTIDAVHSSIVFSVRHGGVVNVYGMLNEKEGTFSLDPDTGELASVSVTAKTESVDTGNDGRDEHLRSADFFNSRQYPDITFTSTSVDALGGNRYRLTGELAMNGETRPVSAVATFLGAGEVRGDQKAGFEATFTVDRTQWGLDAWQGGVGNDISLIVSVSGVKQ